ncbi:MAG: ATP-binding protein [Lachnospiraceae bacterium]
MEACFLDDCPWGALSYLYTLLEALAVRDFFDITLYRRPLKKRYFTLVVLLLFVWMILAAQLVPIPYLKSILILLFYVGEVVVMYEGKLWEKALAVIGAAVVCYLFDMANFGLMSYMSRKEIAVLSNEPVYMYYMSITTKFAQMLLTKMMKCVVGRNRIKMMYPFDRVICIFVPVMILMNLYTNFMSNLQNVEITEWDVYGVLFLILLGVITYFVMYRMGEYYEDMSHFRLLENQLKAGLEYMESLQQAHKKIRQIAHGFKNQISIVNMLLVSGKYDEAKDYLSEISDKVEQNVLPVHTNNVVIDAVLNQMFIIAASKKITMNFNIQDLETLMMNVSDLTTILNNGINNAIEACEKIPPGKPRIIEIQISNEERELIISIQNTTVEKELNIVGNTIPTTKSDTVNHGLGMESIKSAVKKYDGKLFLECQNYNFHLLAAFRAP